MRIQNFDYNEYQTLKKKHNYHGIFLIFFFHQKYTNHHAIRCFQTLVNSIIDVQKVWPPKLCELLYWIKDWTHNLFIRGFLHNPTGSCFKHNLDSLISIISLILSPTPPYPLKRIKTRPDGPSHMGLTDLYPWANEMVSPSLGQVYYKQNTT